MGAAAGAGVDTGAVGVGFELNFFGGLFGVRFEGALGAWLRDGALGTAQHFEEGQGGNMHESYHTHRSPIQWHTHMHAHMASSYPYWH